MATIPRADEAVSEDVVAIVEHLISDWDLDDDVRVSPETRLVEDLDFGSIDVVCLLVAAEDRFGLEGVPWEKLVMEGDDYVDDLTVAEVATFVAEVLNR